jgi:uncharacterized protein
MQACNQPLTTVTNVGIGLRHPHYSAFFETLPTLDFVEVHSENFFAEGGATRALLRQAREHCAVSLHGVGLGLGSAAGIDPWHLARLAELVHDIEPVRVSDHACFARAQLGSGIAHASDLLPIAFTKLSAKILCGNIAQVQDTIKRPILVENLSAYVAWEHSDTSEAHFLRDVCKTSGCQLLLDVNNLYVNALNAGSVEPVTACCRWIDELGLTSVGEIHLAGFTEREGIVIDDHSRAVSAAVWQVYEYAVCRFGNAPSLVEWDAELPEFDALLAEAAKARRIQARE